jgi:predicted alpha/beta-fold hydrolase
MIVTAADDPFVPPEQFGVPAIAGNSSVRVVVTADGGHCGFVSAPRNGSDGYWAEDRVIAFCAAHLSGHRSLRPRCPELT